jgi:signal transduction histidine kinase
MTVIERERLRSLRVSMVAILPLGLVILTGVFTVAGFSTLPVAVVFVTVVVWGAASRLDDRWLERARWLIQGGANFAAAVVIATVPNELAVATAIVTLIVALALPFTTPWPRVVGYHGFAVAVVTAALAVQEIAPATILLIATAYVVVAVFATRAADDLGEALRSLERAREVEGAVAELTDAVLAIDDLDPQAVSDRVVGSTRALGFAAVGVRREHDDGPAEFSGDLPHDAVLAGWRAALASDAATVRCVLDDGREAVALRVDRYGAPYVTIVGAVEPDQTMPEEHVEVLGEVAALASRWLDTAARVADQRRMVTLLSDVDAHKNDVVSSVSHELRTPLTVVKGLAETFLARGMSADTEQGRDLLVRLDANAMRLGSVVDTVLDLARLSAGSVTPELEQADLAALVRAAHQRLTSLSEDHTLVVDADIPAPVLVDPTLLDHVFENLVVNAVKHTPAGTTVELRVRVHPDHAEVEVVDDGPGIPPWELSRVTERFFRGGDSTTRETSGLGLGLALVDRILAAHGTVLEITSQVGSGSRFAFALPLVEG